MDSIIKITIDADKVGREIDDFVEKQLPFATARALTWTAKDAEISIDKSLPYSFTLRNKFLQNSTRITPATKRKLQSEVGFLNDGRYKTDFMELQTESGTKKPRGKNVAIPASSRGLTHVRRGKNSRGVIRRNLKPAVLLNDRKQYFKGKIKGVYGIWKRTGRKDKKGWRRPHLNLMYVLQPTAHVDKHIDIQKIVKKVVGRRFDIHFRRSLNEAR